MKPTAYTAEEVREQFLRHLYHLCDYWHNETRVPDELEKMRGLCFSILNIFDGTTMAFPAMDIRLAPHEDDKDFDISRGKKWYKPGMLINDCVLHDHWNSANPDKR